MGLEEGGTEGWGAPGRHQAGVPGGPVPSAVGDGGSGNSALRARPPVPAALSRAASGPIPQRASMITYPDGLVPMGPKGSKRAPGGTAPGGRRFGRPEDGSMSALGKPDLRGSTIMPPLRHLRQEERWVSRCVEELLEKRRRRGEWAETARACTLESSGGH